MPRNRRMLYFKETIMGYERYPRNSNPQGDYYGRSDTQDYGHDYGSGRSYSYSSARDYQASGAYDDDRNDRNDRNSGQDYGRREYGNQRYDSRERFNRDRDNYGAQGGYGRNDSYQSGSYRGNSDNRYVQQNRYEQGRYEQGRSGGYDQNRYGGGNDQNRYGGGNEQNRYGGERQEYHGSYSHDGRRFLDVGNYSHADDDNQRGRYENRSGYGQQSGQRDQNRQQGYGRQPQGYDYEERGFFARAGDEVRSWFGDEDAERRREQDARYDENSYGNRDSERSYGHRDEDYGHWRRGQIAALDRDYDEYRNENRTKFENEFSSWRTNRQGQRDLLNKVEEHQDVVGSDGEHVGTVDKVRGDRILLTKNDADAGGRHHSIPSSWLKSVDGKVTLSKTASEAKSAWRDEERNQAMFGYGDNTDGSNRGTSATNQSSLNRSTSTSGQSTTGGMSSTGTTSSTGATSTAGQTEQKSGDSTTLNRSGTGSI
ncbi:DUF2171 domain-containing protein [Sphingomonas sp. XXL09]|uniref:DUF2171 domain-containing protein n=1 Tax=Sphingomonas sp. XXL09 TaxID=3457787 RepID=UPI00406BB534